MVYHDISGGAVHCHTVPVVGGAEDSSVTEYGQGHDLCSGERHCWKCGWGDSSGHYDTVRCSEDSNDAREGENRNVDATDHDLEGEWAPGIFGWNRA